MGATENSLYQGKHRSSMMAPAVNYTHRIAADMDPLWAAQNQRRMTVGTKTLRTEHRRGNSVILLVCLIFKAFRCSLCCLGQHTSKGCNVRNTQC